jgi:nitrogen fixation protein FixH
MQSSSTESILTGRRVLIYLLAFFAVVVGVNGVMIKFAIDTLPGTEVDSAYRASLGFNAEISAARAQAQRGWRVDAHVERGADQRAVVRIEARDAQNVPVSGVAFLARLARPTDKRSDRPVTLVEREAGIYRGEASEVPPGQWDLVIEADRGSERVFFSRNRVVLQ